MSMSTTLHILYVALNGSFISIYTRGSDCNHNLSMSIHLERSLSVCQLPNLHFIWQTATSSIFTKHDGNQAKRVSPAYVLASTCKEISDVHQTLALLTRMECVQDCKHDSPWGSDQISAAACQGGGERVSLSWPKKDYKTDTSLSSR